MSGDDDEPHGSRQPASPVRVATLLPTVREVKRCLAVVAVGVAEEHRAARVAGVAHDLVAGVVRVPCSGQHSVAEPPL